MSECIVSGTQWGAQNPIREDDLAARIDALPASAGLWRFIALLSLGGFFELYDLFQTGYISAGLIADGIFHTGQQGVFGMADQAAFASATFLGLFIGASLLSPYADRIGRRATFMYALLWYGLFSLVMAFQHQAEWVIFFRFMVGIGLGVELVTIDTYLTEWVPSHPRLCFRLFHSVSLGSCRRADVMVAGAADVVWPERMAVRGDRWRAGVHHYLAGTQGAAGIPALAAAAKALS